MIRPWLWLSLTVAIGLLLGGCVTDGKIGTAPLSYLSSTTIKHYKIYRANLVRSQSKGPSGTYAYNPATANSGYSVTSGGTDASSRSIQKAIEICGNSESCKILDRNGRIVWKNISTELSQKLLAQDLDQKELMPKVEEYKSSLFSVGYNQIRDFNNYLSLLNTQGGRILNSAFFVSMDGEHTGKAFSDGRDSYHRSIEGAHKSCVINSDQPCYLFAKGDEPVNADAEAAIRSITPIADGSVPENALPARYRDKLDIKAYARHPSGRTWTTYGWSTVHAAMESARSSCQREYGDPCTIVYVGPFRLADMKEETRKQTLMAYEEAHRAYRARSRIYGALIVLARDNLDVDNTAVISPAPKPTELAIRVGVGNIDEIDAVFSQLEQAGMIEWRGNSLFVPKVEALSLALRSDSAGVRMETEKIVGELKRILRKTPAPLPR